MPGEYAQECLRLVRETHAGKEIHDAAAAVWTGDPEEGAGPIQFDLGRQAGEREVEYQYVSHYMDVGDVPVPVYARGTRIAAYGPRYRATCALANNQVVLDRIEEAGEWEGSL